MAPSSERSAPLHIHVASHFGENCITTEDGEHLHGMISSALEKGETVVLDFDGAAVFASPFFNASIGELLRDHDAAELNAGVVVKNLPSDAVALLVRVIENARDYFKNPRVREAVDEMRRADKSGEHQL